MREQKVLIVNLKDGQKLLIVATSIQYVESFSNEACRVYYGDNRVVCIARDYDWMAKFLAKPYDISTANEY